MFSQAIASEVARFEVRQRAAGAFTATRQDLSVPFDETLLDAILDPRFGEDTSWTKVALAAIRRQRLERWQNKIFAIAPLYVTSFCSERCTYCNYRAENKSTNLQRKRLSLDELAQEVQFLLQRGIRTIELVYATDPFVRVDRIAQDIELTKRLVNAAGGGLVGINAEPFDTEEYRTLVAAGLDFAVLWQETYDQKRYSEVHVGKTKKVDYAYRVDGIERMILGGVQHVGMGVLSGLADWRFDWYILLRHIAHVYSTSGVAPSILGVPRMKDAAGAALHDMSKVPSDVAFNALVNVCMSFCPSIRPFVNTRENWSTCLELSEGGGNLFTFNCSTIPGGYKLGVQGYQFPTFTFDVVDYASRAQESGLDVMLDWRFDGLGQHSRGEA